MWKSKEIESTKKLALAPVVLMLVLHHTSVKVVESKAPLDKVLYLPSCLYLSPHPSSYSPLCSLIFLCLVFAERAVCAALSEFSFCLCACVLCIVPVFLNMMRKAWNNNVWGWRATPLFSVSSLFPLCSRFSRWQWCSLQISCRCGPFEPPRTNCKHTYTLRCECKCLHRHVHAHTFT